MFTPLNHSTMSNDEISESTQISLPTQEPEVKTWHHDCSNTSGFEYSEIPIEDWNRLWGHTEIELESDGQSFPMPSIPNTPSAEYYYGPTYLYTLPDVFPLSGLRNFTVHMELNNTNPDDEGLVYVGLFDGLQSAVLLATLGDDELSNYRWEYNVRHETPYYYSEFELDNYDDYDMGNNQLMDYVNSTWWSWFSPSQGLNGGLPSHNQESAYNETFIPLAEVELARDVSYLVLMFGGYRSSLGNFKPLPPIRVHDLRLVYELGGAIDTTPPSLNDVQDIVYILGQTGNVIEWECSDDNPDRYWMVDFSHRLSSSDVIRSKGSWNGSSFTISVDGLDVGTRSFQLYVEDQAGFMVWDYVEVTVIEHPIVSFIRSNAMIIGIAALVVIFSIVIYRGKRT